jgi:hypothetical protein
VGRRPPILGSVLPIALLVYGFLFFALVHRTLSRLCQVVTLSGVKRPAAKDLFGIPPLPDSVDLYGYPVPLWMIVMLWLCIPATWIAFEIAHWVQRQNRERLGLCADCGYRLATPWRGKCPRCGLRVGAG